jgi:hypothetical protein
MRNGPDVVDVIEMKLTIVVNDDDDGGDAPHASQRSNLGFHRDDHPGSFLQSAAFIEHDLFDKPAEHFFPVMRS